MHPKEGGHIKDSEVFFFLMNALFIIGYDFTAFIITDSLKVPVYRLLDNVNIRFMAKPKSSS